MNTQIIKMTRNRITEILGNWIINTLIKKKLCFSIKHINENNVIITYKGQKLFNIPLNYNKIQKRLLEKEVEYDR